MKILALDLGTKTGVAVGDSRGMPECSTEILGEGGSTHAARFAQALRMTNRLIKTHKPDQIVIEAPIAAGPAGGIHRVQMSFGIRAAVFGVAYMNDLEPKEFSVQEIRKDFIGHGRLTRTKAKAKIFEECKRLGWSVSDYEQSDAAAVWNYARARLDNVTIMKGLFGDEIHGTG